MSIKTFNQKIENGTSLRHWFRLTLAYLLIPFFLFISSGDFEWFEGWLYSILILLSGIGSRVLAEQRHPGLTSERQNIKKYQSSKSWDKLLAPLMAFSLVFPMVIVSGLDHRFNWSSDFPIWVNIFGFVLIALGYSFASWALVENRFFFSLVRIDQSHTVCDTGPYQFVRHPGYAGNLLPLFGISFALESLWALIPAMIAIIITVIRTALEDKTLMKELSGYRDYSHRVRYRLIPLFY